MELHGDGPFSFRTEDLHLASPTLPSGRVDMWRLHLDATPADWILLSEHERDRANKFVLPQHRYRFVAARSSLRRILGQYSGVSPASLFFGYGVKGKPRLVSEEGHPLDLQFNLSHSGGVCLIAVTCACELGVDVETRQSVADHDAIARRFFSEREYTALCQVPEHLQERAFLRCWTRKEAYIKALGEGLACSLRSFSVPVSPALMSDAVVETPAGRNYYVRDLNIGEDCIAALATEGGPLPVSYFDIPSGVDEGSWESSPETRSSSG